MKKSTSIDNFQRGKTKGQIATFLILVIVTALLFILVTTNLGKVALISTNLSTAADSASLNLGSQLATKSRMLYQALGNTVEKCKSSNWMAEIGAIIGFIMFPYCPWLGAAIGGAIGGMISGEGALEGAIQGFTFAFKVMVGLALIVIGIILCFTGIGAILGVPMIIGGIALVAGTIYNEYAMQRMTANAIAAAAKALNGLPERDRFEQGAIYIALMATVDDKSDHQDVNDSDADGDITERVPTFQWWWDERIRRLKEESVDTLGILISNFINGPLADFNSFAKGQLKYCSSCDIGNLSRQELDGSDGIIVRLMRRLRNAGYRPGFDLWLPGDAQAYPSCDGCESCPDFIYHDEVHFSACNLKDFICFAESLSAQDLNQLIDAWEDWIRILYDPANLEEAYYGILGTVVNGEGIGEGVFNGLYEWKNEIERLRTALPVCIYGELDGNDCRSCPSAPAPGEPLPPCEQDCVRNSPCRDDYLDPGTGLIVHFGTIDKFLDDEFQEATTAINNLINNIETFREQAKDFYEDMYQTVNSGDFSVDKNPVTYAWQDEAGEDHSITVRVGDFKVPRTAKYKKGSWYNRKVCIGLKDYHDDGTNTWVRIRRNDSGSSNKQIGVLGRWNPFSSGSNISKISRVSFSYNRIRVSGRN